jgi:hypothetical protein
LYVVFIWMPILFSFIPVNVTLLLFPSRTCTTTNTTTTTTDDEKTNRNVWCSLISLSLLLSFLPELSYGFLFLSILSCFFLPRPFFLSLSLSPFYLPGSFGSKTKNQILRALDDKQTREKIEKEKKRIKTKLTSAI